MENEPLEVYKLKLKDLPSDKETKPSTKIQCPCGKKEIPVNDIDLGSKLGKCVDCNVIFSIEQEVASLKNNVKKAQQKIIRPEGIDVFEYDGELE